MARYNHKMTNVTLLGQCQEYDLFYDASSKCCVIVNGDGDDHLHTTFVLARKSTHAAMREAVEILDNRIKNLSCHALSEPSGSCDLSGRMCSVLLGNSCLQDLP